MSDDAAIQSIAEELFGDPVLWRQASPGVQRAYTKIARGIIRALNHDGYEIVRREDPYRPIAGVDDTPQEAG